MPDNLQLQIDRLKIPIGVVQHASVQAIFQVILSQGKERSKDAANALQACMGHSSQVMFAIDQLTGVMNSLSSGSSDEAENRRWACNMEFQLI